MKHIKPILMLLIIIVIIPIYADNKYFNFKSLSLEDGLTQPSVMTISQDGLGRMWFGTYEGLNIYDGNKIISYKGEIQNGHDKKIWLGNFVDFIKTDSKGNMYVVCDGNLFHFDIKTSMVKQITDGSKTTALEIESNKIWYAQDKQVFYIDTANTFKKIKIPCSRINILRTGKKFLYVGTPEGLYTINKENNNDLHLILPDLDIYQIYESAISGLWVGTRMDGLYRLNQNTFRKIPITSDGNGTINNQIREFTEDNEGNIWFGTFTGLQKYDVKHNKYITANLPAYAGGLNHPSIFSLFKDKQGTIWVGSFYGGINYFNPSQNTSFHYKYQPGNNFYYSYIGEMAMDNKKNLWIGTDGGGLSCIDHNWKTIEHFTTGHKNAIPGNNIKSLYLDSVNNTLYIGTHLGGLSRFDLKNKIFYNYLYEPFTGDNPGEIIFRIKKWNNHIILSSRKGVFALNPTTNHFTKLPLTNKLLVVFDISMDGTFYGLCNWHLITAKMDHPEEQEVISLRNYGIHSIPTNIISTTNGAYLCTLGEGLLFFDKDSKRITQFKTENSGIVSNYCYNMKFIHNKKAIITCDKGIMLFDTIKHEFSKIELDAHPAPIINECGIFISPENNIYIGDTKGITFLKGSELETKLQEKPNLYIASIAINNQTIENGDKNSILSCAPPFTKEISLTSNQNNIFIEFACPDYLKNQVKPEFEYKLEGLDTEWNRTTLPYVRYNHLFPGKYIFIVRHTGESKKETRLHITINSPWHKTWWAYCIYSILASCTIFCYKRTQLAKRKLQDSLRKEKFEKQHIEKLNQEKLIFFTNVSHEFRTPLTLINSYIDSLLQNNKITLQIYNTLLKLKQNSVRMNNLIDELLDFRKFTQDHFTLFLSQQNISKYVKELYLTFKDYAQQRNIDFSYESNPENIFCWFDQKQLEKVFFNLLSNAFKHTEDYGKIDIKIALENDNVTVLISDNGHGIPSQDIARIFDRFYLSESFQTNGTGIGLALTKCIIEKHHGQIKVESEVNKGSRFTISLPLNRKEYLTDEHIKFIDSTESIKLPPAKLQLDNTDPNELPTIDQTDQAYCLINNTTKEYKILIIEDNTELISLLQNLFQPYYETFLAHNGEEGLEMVYKIKPDVILSDIMMPLMNGTDLCLKIKNNIDLCHIPIVLLTAWNSIEQNIEGLKRGADDYISKPFNNNILLARINNLVRNRKLIHMQMTQTPINDIDLSSINPLDQKLLYKIENIIEEHINDPEFSIQELCKKIGMGRSLLYTKFKSLTGMTPNKFILNSRLKLAASLLKKHPDLTISEISDRCGFSTPVYFSKCFKEQYHSSPAEYRKTEK